MKKVNKPSSGARHLIKEIKPIFNKHNRYHSSELRTISTRTQTVRWQVIRRALIDLHDILEFKVQSVHHIKQKHIHELAFYWEFIKKYSPGTIQNNLSILRTFFNWLGKRDFIPSTDKLFKVKTTYQRTLCSNVDKSWKGNGVDLGQTIQNIYQYDERVAVQLLYCLAFGMRVSESACSKPHQADLGDRIQVAWGSKGGRYREVTIDDPVQRSVLELMKAYTFKETQSTIPSRYNLKKWLSHFYYVIRVYGDLTKKDLGVTPHGLRHEFAINMYEFLSGLAAPVRELVQLSVQNKKIDRKARVELSEALGHSRTDVVGAYIGQVVGRLSKKS
jgi:site-specific recombinase XerD